MALARTHPIPLSFHALFIAARLLHNFMAKRGSAYWVGFLVEPVPKPRMVLGSPVMLTDSCSTSHPQLCICPCTVQFSGRSQSSMPGETINATLIDTIESLRNTGYIFCTGRQMDITRSIKEVASAGLGQRSSEACRAVPLSSL